MMVQVATFPNGKWRENCYIVGCEDGQALIIDPGSQPDGIAALIAERGWRLCAILNTHAHYDHVGAVEDLRVQYGVPFYLHRADELLLKRANLYRMLFESSETIRIPKETEPLPGDEVVQVGPFSIDCVATPGHTPGSVCFRIGDYLFSGDTLLRGAVGRTDLPGGDRDQLAKSLRKLRSLPGGLVVYAGHGQSTILQKELSSDSPAGRLADESAN